MEDKFLLTKERIYQLNEFKINLTKYKKIALLGSFGSGKTTLKETFLDLKKASDLMVRILLDEDYFNENQKTFINSIKYLSLKLQKKYKTEISIEIIYLCSQKSDIQISKCLKSKLINSNLKVELCIISNITSDYLFPLNKSKQILINLSVKIKHIFLMHNNLLKLDNKQLIKQNKKNNILKIFQKSKFSNSKLFCNIYIDPFFIFEKYKIIQLNAYNISKKFNYNFLLTIKHILKGWFSIFGIGYFLEQFKKLISFGLLTIFLISITMIEAFHWNTLLVLIIFGVVLFFVIIIFILSIFWVIKVDDSLLNIKKLKIKKNVLIFVDELNRLSEEDQYTFILNLEALISKFAYKKNKVDEPKLIFEISKIPERSSKYFDYTVYISNNFINNYWDDKRKTISNERESILNDLELSKNDKENINKYWERLWEIFKNSKIFGSINVYNANVLRNTNNFMNEYKKFELKFCFF